jgi:hypothetical protein
LSEIKVECDRNKWPYYRANARLTAKEIDRLETSRDQAQAILVAAESLIPADFPNPVEEGRRSLAIVMAERHFLRPKDEQVVNFAASLARPCSLEFHMSLDDPLLKVFTGAWLGGLLERLGMTEDTPIENPMIARRIKDAQRHYARSVGEDRHAHSAEEWLHLNVSK